MNGVFFAKKLFSKKSQERIKKKLMATGVKDSITNYEFLNVRLILVILIFMVCLLIPKIGFIVGFSFAFFFYWGMEYLFLDFPINKRNERLEWELLEFLEMLDLALVKKNNLLEALQSVSASLDNDLMIILKDAFQKYELKGSFEDIFKELETKIDNDFILSVFKSLFWNTNGDMYHEIITEYMDDLYGRIVINKRKQWNQMLIKGIGVAIFFSLIISILLILAPYLLKMVLN